MYHQNFTIFFMKKNWLILDKLENKGKKTRLEKIVKILLSHRGIKTKKQEKEFFNPSRPEEIDIKETGILASQIKKAILRIKKALKDKELIVVYGDYDADGISATAILWELLYKLGAKAMPFIPLREKHGYGLKKEGMETLIKEYGKPGLIITVDNGIVAFEGARWCQRQGIDLIISDHHQVKGDGKLPSALAVVHTDKLAGAGVAWFFAREIEKALLGQNKLTKESLELAAIGTVADMMPLVKMNRSLTLFGLKELKKTERSGLRALFTQAQIDLEKINTYNLSFVITPRLNAMGRLENALDSLRLLCTQDDQRAIRLAVNVGRTNQQRQDLTLTALAQAQKKVTASKEFLSQKLLFVASKSYSHGVIGLVAGRLVERFWRPAIVIAQGRQYSKGSVRSIPGVNIIEFLRQVGEEFVDLGGHPMAAGFTIETAKIPKLQKRLGEMAAEQIAEELLNPCLEIEAEIELTDVDKSLYSRLCRFEPFGLGNRRPVFCSRNMEVVSSRAVGRDEKHFKMRVKTQGKGPYFEAIFFNGADKVKALDLARPVDLAFQIDENEWNGQKSLQLVVKDALSSL